MYSEHGPSDRTTDSTSVRGPKLRELTGSDIRSRYQKTKEQRGTTSEGHLAEPEARESHLGA